MVAILGTGNRDELDELALPGDAGQTQPSEREDCDVAGANRCLTGTKVMVQKRCMLAVETLGRYLQRVVLTY